MKKLSMVLVVRFIKLPIVSKYWSVLSIATLAKELPVSPIDLKNQVSYAVFGVFTISTPNMIALLLFFRFPATIRKFPLFTMVCELPKINY